MPDEHTKPKPPPIEPVKSYYLTPEEIAKLRAEARGTNVEPPKSYYLTPDEIAKLRAEAKANREYFRKAFPHMRPKAKPDGDH